MPRMTVLCSVECQIKFRIWQDGLTDLETSKLMCRSLPSSTRVMSTNSWMTWWRVWCESFRGYSPNNRTASCRNKSNTDLRERSDNELRAYGILWLLRNGNGNRVSQWWLWMELVTTVSARKKTNWCINWVLRKAIDAVEETIADVLSVSPLSFALKKG